jgi:F0F1-type ATP synthase membrane subunit b/b'
MERIWEELMTIEKEAEQIRSRALQSSEKIIAIATEDAKKLVTDSRKHSEEESEKILKNLMREAIQERDDALLKNERVIKDVMTTVEKRFNEAVGIVLDIVLGKRTV